MKIQNVLEKRGILMDVKAPEKTELLTQMVRYLTSLYDLKNPDAVQQRILEREAQASTGIGYGIAIPHARLDTVDRIYMIAGRCVSGIEFGAIDDLPVHLIFMMLSPANASSDLMKVLSSVSKMMSYEETRRTLLDATDAESFFAHLVEGENRYAG